MKPRSLLSSLSPSRRAANQAKAREADLLRWTVKVLGSDLVQRHYDAGLAGPKAEVPPEPVPTGLTSRACRQADIESPWLRHWSQVLGAPPFYHRKLWEDCFILQALWENGAMQPGRTALCFAVGQEPLPAVLASRGVAVLATDIDAADGRAQDWVRTGQHGTGTDPLHRPHLSDRAAFERMVRFRIVDMAAIPADLRQGGFDMVWSACAMEHLGSLEGGCDFVLAAMECLKPGGIAVHTTELNLDAGEETLEDGPTVLYRPRHLAALAERLAAAGHRMLAPDLDPGHGILDRFVDVPPYDPARWPMGLISPPHLRLSVGGYAATSVGIVAIKGVDAT